MADLSKTSLTQREQTILEAILEATADAIKVRDIRIAVLESRLEALQSKTLADSFKGSWFPSTRYARGELVQKGNSLWMALDATTDTPGHSPNWRQLAGAR
jgi:hypothetical protein